MCKSSNFPISFHRHISISLAAIIFSLTLPMLSTQAKITPQKLKSATVVSIASKGKNIDTISNQLLPPRLALNWRATEEIKKLTTSNFFNNQENKIYLEYGLQSIVSRSYTNNSSRVIITAFEMKYPSGAYGLWTFNRSSITPERREFNSGRYLIRIDQSTGARSDIDRLTASLQQHLSSSNLPDARPAQPEDLPLLPTYLPEQDKIAGSEKYLVGPAAVSAIPEFADIENLIDFTGGTHAASAAYHNGSNSPAHLLLIEYQTPQFASAGYQQLITHINSLREDERRRRLVKRIGNYVVEAVNFEDTSAAIALLDQIKYMVKVYWEGERMNSIPLEYRPPDPLAINEAIETGKLLIAVFYWISLLLFGAVMVGLITGWVFFYWGRVRRRRLGIDDVFSDAGGMIRLNLDKALPSPNKAWKLIDKVD